MKLLDNYTGLSLREALCECRRLGLPVAVRRRHGEVMVTLPTGVRLTVNGRRRDAPRVLSVCLRKRAAQLRGLATAGAKK